MTLTVVQGRQLGWESSTEILDGVTGQSILIPDGRYNVTVAVIPGSGASGKVQYTVSTQSQVGASTANWQDWPSGDVLVDTSDTLIGPVTAIRGVSTSGTITVEVRI